MYKVIKNVRVGTTINDGSKRLNKLLSECTQEELQALYEEIKMYKHVEKISDETPPKKKRNNKKGKPPTRLEDFEVNDTTNSEKKD